MPEMRKVIIFHFSILNNQTQGETALHLCCLHGHLDNLALLFSCGVYAFGLNGYLFFFTF
jgi:hypothetical protein